MPVPSAPARVLLQHRPLEARDVVEAQALLPPWLVRETTLVAALPALWSRLCDHPATVAGVIEDTAQPAGHRLQGLGFTLIVPRDWIDGRVEAARADARRAAGLSAEVYAAVLDGSLALPDERAIGRANAGEGIVCVALHYYQHSMDLQDAYVRSVINMANEAFRVYHSGHRIAAFYQVGLLEHGPYLEGAGFRRWSVLPPDAPAHTVALWGRTREEAAAMMPGNTIRHVFEHTPPRFGLSASQRRLLWLALFDEREETLQRRLEVSVHGLKKLWRGIYERIEDVAPSFFGDEAGGGADEGKRGPEKRRRVLAYVRQRLEELRPWSP